MFAMYPTSLGLSCHHVAAHTCQGISEPHNIVWLRRKYGVLVGLVRSLGEGVI